MRYELGNCLECGHKKPIINKKYFLCQDCNKIRLHGSSFSKSTTHYKPAKIRNNHFGFDKQVDMFVWIWENRPQRSEVSGASLKRYKMFSGDWFKLFSHLLPKGSYSKWKLNPDNIILKTPQEHEDWHSISRSELEKDEKWKPIFERYDNAKTDYYRTYYSAK